MNLNRAPRCRRPAPGVATPCLGAGDSGRQSLQRSLTKGGSLRISPTVQPVEAMETSQNLLKPWKTPDTGKLDHTDRSRGRGTAQRNAAPRGGFLGAPPAGERLLREWKQNHTSKREG